MANSPMWTTLFWFYWQVYSLPFKDGSKNGKVLCSECTPVEFSDGSKTGKGKWHGRFPKLKWDGRYDVANR